MKGTAGVTEALMPPAVFAREASTWILVAKDYLKRTFSLHDEAELMLGSLQYLRRHEPRELIPARDSKDDTSHYLYGQTIRGVGQTIARLRALREEIRGYMLAMEMAGLGVSYGDLMDRKDRRVRGRPRGQVVRPCPSSLLDSDESADLSKLRDDYCDAVDVLFYTPAHVALQLLESHLAPKFAQLYPGVAGGFVRAPVVRKVEFFLDLLTDKRRVVERLKPRSRIRRVPRTIRSRRRERANDIWWGVAAEILLELQREVVTHTQFLASCDEEEFAKILRAWVLGFQDAGSEDAFVQRVLSIVARSVPISEKAGSALAAFGARMRSSEGDRALSRLVEMVIRVGEEAWHWRRARVERIVDEFRVGHPLHGHAGHAYLHDVMFRAMRNVALEFRDILAVYSQLVSALQQRSPTLPPTLQRLPHFHRRGRESVEATAVRLVRQMEDDVSALVGRVMPRWARLQRADIVFDYRFGSRVVSLDVVPGVTSSVVVAPFFVIEAPRFLIEVLHEVAHLRFSAERLEPVFRPSPEWSVAAKKAGWHPRVAEVLRTAGGRLRAVYAASGTQRALFPESAVIAEVLADFVALCIGGPHYAHSLFSATLPVAILPRDSDGNPDAPRYGTQINPIVRVQVMLNATRHLGWDRFPSDEAEVRGWDPRRLRPLQQAVHAYLDAFDRSAMYDLEDDTMLRLFVQEVNVLTDCLEELVDVLDEIDTSWRPLGWMPVEHGTWADELWQRSASFGASEDDALLAFRGPVSTPSGDGEPRAEDANTPTSASAPARFVFGALCPNGEASRVELVHRNVLNLLWDSSAALQLEALRRYAAGPPEQRRAALERAIWSRAPEVRPLVASMGESNLKDDVKSGAVVLTVAEVDFLWSSRTGPTWFPMKARSGAAAAMVVGGQDAQVIDVLHAGNEELTRSIRSVAELVSFLRGVEDVVRSPSVAHHALVRTSDYEVTNTWPVRAESESTVESEARRVEVALAELANCPIAALVQLRVGKGAREVNARIISEIVGAKDQLLPILRSFGWDHYAALIRVESAEQLFRTLRRLFDATDSTHHTFNLLLQRRAVSEPGTDDERDADRATREEQQLSEALRRLRRSERPRWVVLTTRLRVSPGAITPETVTEVMRALKACREHALDAHLRVPSGPDDLAVTIAFPDDAEDGYLDACCDVCLAVARIAARVFRAFDVKTTVFYEGLEATLGTPTVSSMESRKLDEAGPR